MDFSEIIVTIIISLVIIAINALGSKKKQEVKNQQGERPLQDTESHEATDEPWGETRTLTIDDIFKELRKAKEEAEQEEKHGNYVTEVEGGYRRIVAAPKPQGIIEIDSIKALSDQGQVVIACGGGGIPVLEQGTELKGASAVIEKDYTSGRLAEQLDADELLILTSVEKVSVNFHKQDEEELGEISVAQAKEYMAEGQFEANTMLPKIQASVEFVEQGEGKKAVITSIDKAVDAYLGRTGTVIC